MSGRDERGRSSSGLLVGAVEWSNNVACIEVYGAIESIADSGVGIDAKGGVDSGSEVIRGPCGGVRPGADFVCLSQDLTGHDAGTSEECGEAGAPVIAAGIFVDFGGPAEFSEEDHHGLLEQSAVGEVVEESGDGLIEGWEEAIFESLKDAPVIIPVLHGPHVGLNDGDSGFNKPSSEEQGLSEGIPAVAFADGIGFTVEFKGLRQFSGREHGEGKSLIFGEASDGGVACEGGRVVEGIEE